MKLNIFKRNKKDQGFIVDNSNTYTEDHGYSLVKDSSLVNKKYEFEFNLAKQYDNYGYMSEELGRELETLFEDEDYILGIHRTGYTQMTNELINKIFNEGLINNGHVMQGGMDGMTDINKTVSLYQSFTLFTGQLKAASGYKNSQGCFIIKIPKSYVGYKNGEIKPIYYKTDVMNLLPEFIYGYVPVKDNKLENIIRNPNYKNIHNYDNKNLYYDDSVYYKAKREGINLYFDESMQVAYNVLSQAYLDTHQKYGYDQAITALLELINNKRIDMFTKQENRQLLSQYVVNRIDIIDMLKKKFSLNEELSINEIINNFVVEMNNHLENNISNNKTFL